MLDYIYALVVTCSQEPTGIVLVYYNYFPATSLYYTTKYYQAGRINTASLVLKGWAFLSPLCLLC